MKDHFRYAACCILKRGRGVMKQLPFKKIDAFATENSDGNPAGYIRLKNEDELSEAEMQKIAIELKGFVSEVGFASPLDGEMYNLRYFSSEREVDFCGHATIAIMYDMMSSDERLAVLDKVLIRTKKGDLTVENRLREEDAVFIMSPGPIERAALPEAAKIAESLKIPASAIDSRYPVSLINAGLSTLIVPIRELSAVLSLSPNLESLKSFCLASGADIIEVFTEETVSRENSYRTRVFAPTFGYLEDPATGSGNSALGYYLVKRGLWKDQGTISIEQNGLRDRFNVVKLRRKEAGQATERIYFGGRGITRIFGEYLLH